MPIHNKHPYGLKKFYEYLLSSLYFGKDDSYHRMTLNEVKYSSSVVDTDVRVSIFERLK